MIRDHSYKYGVDDSHNHKHSSEVLHFVSEINMNYYDTNKNSLLEHYLDDFYGIHPIKK